MNARRSRILGLLLGGIVLLTAAPGLAGPAAAGARQPTVVSDDPVNYTPNLVADDTVAHPATYALWQRDAASMFVGGTFHGLEESTRTKTYVRNNLALFDPSTGAISKTFLPRVDGPVWAVRSLGTSIFIGGEFSNVDGQPRQGVARLNGSTGRLEPDFVAKTVKGKITDLRLVNGRVIVAGTFGKRLAALDPTTGADTGYLDLGITGDANPDAIPSPTHVYRIAVSPDKTKLIAIGNFGTVSGQARARAFMVDLGTTATLSPWYYSGFAKSCRLIRKEPSYLRDVDFSPDGKYFAIVAVGGTFQAGDAGVTVCDAAARFETNIASPTKPTWINYTGGDSLHSVAVTGSAVYVSGHQRYLDNTNGRDACAPGCSPRQGIGAIDPVSGKALPWNPGKSRQVGGKDLLATAAGLWVGSDGERFSGEYRYGIAFAPLP